MHNAWVLGSFTTKENYFNDYVLYDSLFKKNVNVRSLDFHKMTVDANNNIVYEDSEILQEPDFVIFSQPILNLDANIMLNPHYKNLDDEFNVYNINPVIEKFKSFNTVFFNTVDSHIKCNNKISMYKALITAGGIGLPITKILRTESTDEEIETKANEVGGFPVVLKDPLSTAGRGVCVCNSLREIKDVFLNRKAPLLKTIIPDENIPFLPFLIQQYIDTKGMMLDLRVVGSKIYSRLVLSNPYVDQFKSNVDDKKSYIACKTTPEIEDIVTKSMAALGVNIARFDVFITNEGLKICEVNSIGSIMTGEQTWNKKIRDDIVNFCINEYEKR